MFSNYLAFDRFGEKVKIVDHCSYQIIVLRIFPYTCFINLVYILCFYINRYDVK